MSTPVSHITVRQAGGKPFDLVLYGISVEELIADGGLIWDALRRRGFNPRYFNSSPVFARAMRSLEDPR